MQSTVSRAGFPQASPPTQARVSTPRPVPRKPELNGQQPIGSLSPRRSLSQSPRGEAGAQAPRVSHVEVHADWLSESPAPVSRDAQATSWSRRLPAARIPLVARLLVLLVSLAPVGAGVLLVRAGH